MHSVAEEDGCCDRERWCYVWMFGLKLPKSTRQLSFQMRMVLPVTVTGFQSKQSKLNAVRRCMSMVYFKTC